MADCTVRTLRRPAAPVHGTLFLPASAEPPAGVLLIGGSGGSEPSYVGEALAAEGIAALSVAYFGRPGLPGQLRGIGLEYFFSALRVLRTALAPGVPLAVLGMSRGSEAAMLTAIHAGVRVSAVVAAVPGNVVAGSWPPGGPAWLLGGRALPYVDHSGPESEDADALIPVELVPGPILFVAAGADRVWPSAEMASALSGRLREHGDAHGHTVLEYPDAGHSLGYLLPQLPPGLLPPELDDEPADRAARADAWPMALEFIRRLGTPVGVRRLRPFFTRVLSHWGNSMVAARPVSPAFLGSLGVSGLAGEKGGLWCTGYSPEPGSSPILRRPGPPPGAPAYCRAGGI